MENRGIWLPLAVIITLLGISVAVAAPDRFDNQIPDAVPDPENVSNISISHLNVNTEGPVTNENAAHLRLKYGYQFSEKLHASFQFNKHDLAGGIGLTNPVFSNLDSATSYGLRLEMNLLNEAATPAGPDNNPAWMPGSAFTVGFLGNIYDLDRSGIGEQETEVGAFLSYSTDLTEEMRGHTYFSTSRLTGDNSSGSLNRVGAGLDYLLQEGERPLTLMANGLIDIYNFRQPQFNASRISRFDLGLRYRMSRQWDAQLGWSTFNDSEQDSSGSGLFAGINWRNLKEPCHCGGCEDCSNMLPKEEKPAEGEQPPAQASMDPVVVAAAANLKWDPEDTPMMDLSYPEGYSRSDVEGGLHGRTTASADDTARSASAIQPQQIDNTAERFPIVDQSASEVQLDTPPTDSLPVDSEQPGDDDGIDIPMFPASQPRLEASAELMVRPRSSAAVPLAEDSIINDITVPDNGNEAEPTGVDNVSEVQTENADEATEVPLLQSFVPSQTSADARLSRAPSQAAGQKHDSDGISDACSRYLFLRLASIPRILMASGG